MTYTFELSTISIPLNLYFSLIKIYCKINNITFNYKIQDDHFGLLVENKLIVINNNLIDITEKGMSLIVNSFNFDILSKFNKKLINEEVDNRLTYLTNEMRNIFPEGLKDGKWYFKSNASSVKEKLDKFFKKYGYNKYTNDQILAATRNYVNNFQNNIAGMSILKYFIEKKDNGSILLDYIEQLDNNVEIINKIGNTNTII